VKALVGVHHFPPYFRGGAELRAYRTSRYLQKKGVDVRVVCVDSIKYGSGHSFRLNERVYNGLRVHGFHFNLAKSRDPFLWSYRNPVIKQELCKMIDAFEPDLFHLFGGYLMSGSTIEAAVSKSVKTVVSLTDFWFACPRIMLLRSDNSVCHPPLNAFECALCLRKEKRRYRLPDMISRGVAGTVFKWIWSKNNDNLVYSLDERRNFLISMLKSVDAVISPSRFLKAFFESQGLPKDRIAFIRQGVDSQNWKATQGKAARASLQIGYIGQIAKHKGVDILVRAFCRLQRRDDGPRLRIYGDPEQFPEFTNHLKRLAKGRNDIVFAGRFDNASIKQIHNDIDILVVPSIWHENSPNVILEAFANHTPVVASELGGMRELISDGERGCLFQPGNAESLAVALQRFVDRPELSKRLSQHPVRVKTVQDEMKEMAHIYASLLPNNHNILEPQQT